MNYKFKSTSYEFKSTSYEFKSTNYEFKRMSCEFKSTSYEFKSTSYKLKSLSYEFKSTSCELKSKSSRIISSMKFQSYKTSSFPKIISLKSSSNLLGKSSVQLPVIISCFTFSLFYEYGFSRKQCE